MFSGIVEAMGTVQRVTPGRSSARLEIEVPTFSAEVKIGDSVAVDGTCLTVTEIEGQQLSFDVIGTTLEKTIAGGYREGSAVNLERALRLGDRLDGHIVQGHVDGTGHLIECVKHDDYWTASFQLPLDVHAHSLHHGSVTLNGVSLTIAELGSNGVVRVGLIPHTYAHTNLGALEAGDPVNVEGDVIGKYVARLLPQRDEEVAR